MTPRSERLERAKQVLANRLYDYSGLGTIHYNDLRPEIDELISAARAEGLEEAALEIVEFNPGLAAAIRALAKGPPK